jgi:RHS repeat-associated protein
MCSSVSADVAYKFTGQEFDGETGLWNFRARMYDDELGMFYAYDPAAQGFSPFGYANNNPIIYTDPNGKFPWLAPILLSAFWGVTHAEYNNQTWFEGLAIGAVKGGISAGIGAIVGPAIGATSLGGSIGIGTGTNVFQGMIEAGIDGREYTITSFLTDAIIGGVSGALSYAGGDRISEDLAFNDGGDPPYWCELQPVYVFANRVPIDMQKISLFKAIVGVFLDILNMHQDLGDDPNYSINLSSGEAYGKIPDNTGVNMGIVPGSISGPETAGTQSVISRFSRSSTQKSLFLKELGNSGKNAKWMNNWLLKGKVPPGFHVDHRIPLSIGGKDIPSNMRLLDINFHKLHHSYYRPWLKNIR